ncbi:hypothetical protein L0156_15355 [bacterium]|nr:hypothetical protein [bacterium]
MPRIKMGTVLMAFLLLIPGYFIFVTLWFFYGDYSQLIPGNVRVSSMGEYALSPSNYTYIQGQGSIRSVFILGPLKEEYAFHVLVELLAGSDSVLKSESKLNDGPISFSRNSWSGGTLEILFNGNEKSLVLCAKNYDLQDGNVFFVRINSRGVPKCIQLNQTFRGTPSRGEGIPKNDVHTVINMYRSAFPNDPEVQLLNFLY